MKEQVERALGVLVDMPVWAIGRAADMAWFHFGDRRIVQDRRGCPKEVGAYALHILCSWRIVGLAGLVVGWRDLYCAPGDDPYAFEGIELPTRRDALTDTLLAQTQATPLVVVSAQADEVGGFCIQLSGDYTLEVFPDATLPDKEYWRIFQPSVEAEHFVMTGAGIET